MRTEKNEKNDDLNWGIEGGLKPSFFQTINCKLSEYSGHPGYHGFLQHKAAAVESKRSLIFFSCNAGIYIGSRNTGHIFTEILSSKMRLVSSLTCSSPNILAAH